MRTTATAIRRLVAVVFAVLLFFGSSESYSLSPDGKLKVVTTTGMIADLARHVGGAEAEVVALMGSGVDPHLYKATQTDLQKIQSADIIFYNGIHLEGKMSEVLEKVSRTRPCFAVTADMDPAVFRKPMEFEGQFDPHIWFDVSLWIEALRKVTKEMKAISPTHADVFATRSAQYEKELKELHLWVQESITRIPVERRVLITAHDAFGYFGRAYGVEVMGLQGISTASEFGLHDLTKLVEVVVARKIKAIFVESSVPKKFIESLQEGVQARGGVVQIGGELFSDAIGAEGTKEGTYVGMVQHNVAVIEKALK